MRKRTSALVLALFLAPELAAAQTSTCQWIGAVWTCNSVPPPRAPVTRTNPFEDWQMPDVGSSVMQSFEQGQRAAEERRRAQFEAERLAAEAEYYRSLAKSQETQRSVVPQATFVASIEERKAIGELLRTGNCPLAIDRALTAGDIELAKNIQGFCAGSAVAQPTP